MEKEDIIFYKRIATNSVEHLKIRTVYDDVFIAVDDDGVAYACLKEHCFNNELDAQAYEPD